MDAVRRILRRVEGPGAVSGWLLGVLTLFLDSLDPRTLVGDWRYVAIVALVIGGLFALGIYFDLNTRIASLEDDRKVKLQVQGGKLDSFAISQDGAVLIVDAAGLDQVVDFSARVIEVLWDAGTYSKLGVEQPGLGMQMV